MGRTLPWRHYQGIIGCTPTNVGPLWDPLTPDLPWFPSHLCSGLSCPVRKTWPFGAPFLFWPSFLQDGFPKNGGGGMTHVTFVENNNNNISQVCAIQKTFGLWKYDNFGRYLLDTFLHGMMSTFALATLLSRTSCFFPGMVSTLRPNTHSLRWVSLLARFGSALV